MEIRNKIESIAKEYGMAIEYNSPFELKLKRENYSILFTYDELHKNLETFIVDNHNNHYEFMSIKLFFKLFYIRKELKQTKEEIEKRKKLFSKTKNNESIFTPILFVLENIKTNYDFLLKGDFSWVADYNLFWSKIKELGRKILELDENNPLRKEYLNVFASPLSWLDSAKSYFNFSF
jgi:hypothetical protein